MKAFKFIFFIAPIVFVLSSQYASAKINCRIIPRNHLKDVVQKVMIDISVCSMSNQGQQIITVQVYEGNKKLQTYKFNSDLDSYVVSFTQDIDINADEIHDLGIANGEGKGGDGMRYWLVSTKTPYLSLIGDYPLLHQAKDKTIYSIISGSGDVTATRINYKLVNSKLVSNNAIQYKTVEDGAFEIQLLEFDSSNPYGKFVGDPIKCDSKKLELCMAGGACE